MSFRLDYKIAADPQKFIDGINRALAKMEEANTGAKRFNETGTKGSKIFDGMVNKLMGFATVGGAIALAGSALRKLEGDATAAWQKIQSVEGALKQVAQIAETPARMVYLEQMARDISMRTGMTQEASLGIIQLGLSQGLTEESIHRLSRAKGFERDPKGLVEGIADLYKVAWPGGKAEPERIMNALLQAQKPTKLYGELIAGLATRPAGLAPILGGTMAETVAATTFGVLGAGSPEEGVTQLRSFLGAMVKSEQFKGMGLGPGFAKFVGMSEEEQKAVTGDRKEAIIFAEKLRKQHGLYTQFLIDTQTAIGLTGTPESPFEVNIRAARGSPRLRAIEYTQKVAARQAVAREDMGIQEGYEDALIELIDTRMVEEGRNWLQRAGAYSVLKALEKWWPGGVSLSTLARQGAADISGGTLGGWDEQQRIYSELMEPLQDIAASNRDMLNEVRSQRGDEVLNPDPIE
jgi:hypothetical protein